MGTLAACIVIIIEGRKKEEKMKKNKVNYITIVKITAKILSFIISALTMLFSGNASLADALHEFKYIEVTNNRRYS